MQQHKLNKYLLHTEKILILGVFSAGLAWLPLPLPSIAKGDCNYYGCWGTSTGGCNYYGCWENSGGCNYYGCWNSATGSCNYYGCTDNGECNYYGCPKASPLPESEAELVKCIKSLTQAGIGENAAAIACRKCDR
ncbi:MAG: hypothetical protein KME08_06780 [Aphanothece sp. CMT-3BRIN-NPC111]|jgi:hypothetical protein|nr:hypothetical protein [Aphanothece sp. CMT-3BRIN-NPC111]